MKGGFKLFQFRGVDVYLHWSWLLVAAVTIGLRTKAYTSPIWNVGEYLAVFVFVLLHEFGHVFACRQTGGQSHEIMLWPLGGVAYVNPPPRPGAQLWSIAAGPLVNVGLIVVLKVIGLIFHHYGWVESAPEAYAFLKTLAIINLVMLLFNLLPVYPLDGGQIVRSLLWFLLGPAKSLLIATIIGFAGALAVGALAIWLKLTWTALIAVYLLSGNWAGFQRARAMGRVEKLPRNPLARCPHCRALALQGDYWRCPHCQNSFDLFASRAVCPHCGTATQETPCVDCGWTSSVSEWMR